MDAPDLKSSSCQLSTKYFDLGLSDVSHKKKLEHQRASETRVEAGALPSVQKNEAQHLPRYSFTSRPLNPHIRV